MRLRVHLAALIAALALAIPAAASAQHFPADDDLRTMLRYLVEDGETPGIVIGIREADGSTRVLSYGSAGRRARPLGPRSVFEIGSINKTFTGTLLADMVARGEVALDDPISKYLPEGVGAPSRNGKPITLLHLATHRSGLPRLPDNHTPVDRSNPYADYTIEKLYEFLSGHAMRREPGAEGEYSNLGFGLLGHLLARAAGTSYVDLVRERILEPLGMDMTAYALEGRIAEWMTRGHRDGEAVPFWFATEAIQGAGGLRSSMEDMLKYLEANVGPPETDLERAMRAAQAYHAPVEGRTTIGLGWQRIDHEGRALITHGGGTGGFSTLIAFEPDAGIGIVRLANAADFEDDIALDFLRRGPPLAIAEVPVPADRLRDYVGEFDLAPGRSMVVRLEDEGWLTLQAPGNVRFRMHAASDTSFFVKRTPWRFAFTRDEAGEVVGVVADIEGTVRRARKVGDGSPAPEVVAGNAAPDAADLPLTPEDRARYEGTYTLRVGERTLDLTASSRGIRLVAQATGQPVTHLLYQGDHEFRVVELPDARLVFTIEDGRATKLTLYQGVGVFVGERTDGRDRE